VPRRLYVTPNPHKKHQRGQSLVEFALSSVVLLLLVGGLVDIGRGIYLSETLANAAREGARHAAWFDAPNLARPYLDDADIKAAVDQELAAASLPASVLRNSVQTCPTASDLNGFHNPPYQTAYYPTSVGVTWLYICYVNTPGIDYTSPPANAGGADVNVIVVYTYAPLTPLINSQFGTFRLAANEHIVVQGP
jgi:Flp pilus assembly protein TadG